ncbi:VENN motif pre-toxin domain-containing protein [Histophilus somni]|uniref:VENN motif pre-toxin domain-containing protein n=1 Tax=Histophilus somni TaxID=731 RepID=UPI0018ED3111|nr:VENN motif pre-toxin domain-containing protein [Histophilus somni]QQF84831.1 VENN motif pre-toxin domain-containing protein [Histophilus somni]
MAEKALEQVQANPNASSSEIEAKLTALIEATQAQKQWDNNGTYNRTAKVLTTVLTGVLANQSAGAIGTKLVGPTVNNLIKQATTDENGDVNLPLNILAHATWGAIEATVADGNAAAGAVSAATAELAAPRLAKLLYNKTEVSQLTAEERQHIITLSSIAGAVAGGVTSQANKQSNTTANTLQNAALGGEIGESAVEFNALSLKDVYQYQKALKAAIQNGESVDEVHKKFRELSEKQRAELFANCEIECRVTVPNELLKAVGLADELSGALNSWIQGLPFEEQSKFYQLVEEENTKTIEVLKAQQSALEEEQSKFYQLVEEENTKTIEVLKAQQSALEKGAELALGVAHLLAKEEALNQSSSEIFIDSLVRMGNIIGLVVREILIILYLYPKI